MEMKYIHLRKHEVYYSHPTEEIGKVVELSPKGGATIAYAQMEPVTETLERYMLVICKCNPTDHFNKRLGRIIANGRADAGQAMTIDLPIGLPRGELRTLLVEQYYRSEERYFPDIRRFVW